MVDLKLRREVERENRLKALRGVDKRTCEESGGQFLQIGNEKLCVMEERLLKNGKLVKRPDIEVIDVTDRVERTETY